MRGRSIAYLHQQEFAPESRYSRGSTAGRTPCLHLTTEQKACSLLSVPSEISKAEHSQYWGSWVAESEDSRKPKGQAHGSRGGAMGTRMPQRQCGEWKADFFSLTFTHQEKAHVGIVGQRAACQGLEWWSPIGNRQVPALKEIRWT